MKNNSTSKQALRSGIALFAAFFVSATYATEKVSINVFAHHRGVDQYGNENWIPAKGVDLCVFYGSEPKKTEITGNGAYNAILSPLLRRTNAQGQHNFDIGPFSAFDGRLHVVATKAGHCPQECEAIMGWDENSSQAIYRNPPTQVNCAFSLTSTEKKNGAITTCPVGKKQRSFQTMSNVLAKYTWMGNGIRCNNRNSAVKILQPKKMMMQPQQRQEPTLRRSPGVIDPVEKPETRTRN